MLKVRVAVSEAATRRLVCSLLETQPDVVVLAGAADGGDSPADVLIVDGAPHQPGACALIETVRRAQPRTRAIILLAQPTSDAIHAALTAGASGIVARAQPARELLGAIRVVAQGGSYLCPLSALEPAAIRVEK